MQPQLITAGVDVAKVQLVTCILPSRLERNFPNTPAGCSALCRWLNKHGVMRTAFEPTGGYERALHGALERSGLSAWRVNPRQARRYAESMGRLDKTDRIDAGMLADYAATQRYRVTPVPDPALAQLRALLRARGRLQKSQLALRNAARLSTGAAARVLKASERALTKQLARLAPQIRSAARATTALRDKLRLLGTLPGVGPLTAAQIAAELPELGEVPRGVAMRIAGVTPARNQSGESEKPAHIRGGRPRVRYALYMPTWSAILYNERLGAHYGRLLEKGKPKKVAQIACMHKLLVWADAVLRSGAAWDPSRVR